MRKLDRWIGMMLGTLFLIGATSAFAQDWPQWRGKNRDGMVTKFAAPKAWPKELTQKWRWTVGTGDSTPALVGTRLYVFTRQAENEVVMCLDAATGKQVWQDKYAAESVSGPASSHPGPRSSPTVAGGKVVTLGVSGVLSCLDATAGKVVWRKEDYAGQIPQFGTAMSPIIVDKMCIAHLGGKGSGAIIAYDLATGAEKWKCAGDGPSYSSPVLMTVGGTKQLVLFTEKNLEGVALADGKILWQIPVQPARRYYNSATPIVDGQTVIYTGQGQGTTAVKIEKTGDSFSTKELWVNKDVGTGFSTPVLTKFTLHYGDMSASGTLNRDRLFGLSDKGSYFCLNAQTGQTAWTDTVTRRENYAGIVDAGAVIMGLPNDSMLSFFQPSDKGYVELARYKVADTPTFACPVVSGNRIYVKDQDTLALWTVP